MDDLVIMWKFEDKFNYDGLCLELSIWFVLEFDDIDVFLVFNVKDKYGDDFNCNNWNFND